MAAPNYITPLKFKALGPVPEAFARIPEGDVLAHAATYSRFIDSYLRDRFRLPLLTWGEDIEGCVAALMSWALMTHRGYNPTAGADAAIKEARDFWLAWLDKVKAGEVTPDVTGSEPGGKEGVSAGGLRITTTKPRGW